jgi:hypothetical protein
VLVLMTPIVMVGERAMADTKQPAANDTRAAAHGSSKHASASLPDWNGDWLMTGGTTHAERLLFDPEHVYIPRDPGGGADFGALAGSYDTAIPYKPEYQKQYQEVIKKTEDGMDPDPLGGCMQPHGMPRQMGGIPMAPEILVTPSMVLMSWTFMGAQRRIYTDGRGHPDPAKFPPNYMGHSIGHWEGDTLVVDTGGMVAGIYDMSGAPFSDQVHVTERIRLVNKNTLEDRMIIGDPVMLTKPWQVTRRYIRTNTRFPDVQLEYCPPGTAVDFSKGYQELVLPSEQEAKQKAPEPKKP